MVYGEYVYQRVGNPTITSVLLILIDIFSHKTKFINNKSRTRGAGRCFVMGTNAIAQQYSSRTLYSRTLPHSTFPPCTLPLPTLHTPPVPYTHSLLSHTPPAPYTHSLLPHTPPVPYTHSLLPHTHLYPTLPLSFPTLLLYPTLPLSFPTLLLYPTLPHPSPQSSCTLHSVSPSHPDTHSLLLPTPHNTLSPSN